MNYREFLQYSVNLEAAECVCRVAGLPTPVSIRRLKRGEVNAVFLLQLQSHPDLILKVHESGGKVACYKQDCYWLDIGRMDDYGQAQEDFENNQALFLGESSD